MTSGKQIRTALTDARAQHHTQVKHLKKGYRKAKSKYDMKQDELSESVSKLNAAAKARQEQHDKDLQALECLI